MKLLSIKAVLKGSKEVVTRFPVAMLAAVAGTAIGMYLVHNEMTDELLNGLLTLTLAAPLYVAAVLVCEAKNFSKKIYWGIHVLIALFLTGYYFLLPSMETAVGEFYIRHTMWAIGFVLVVTFVSFLFQKQTTAIERFWQYNRGMVFAFVLTVIWAVAIMIGISIALGSIDFLFEINIEEEVYQDIWVFLVGVFSPLFFLSRLPIQAHRLKSKEAYPKEVRLFSQFVLVPLVTIYFLILYAYTIRILISSLWPEGQLAWMILGFSFLGVLTYLALFPLREKESWIKHFGTALYVAMIPQTGMLFWALWFRLDEYGFTENRYFVFVFGIWLLVTAVYYLVAKTKDIRMIPISLFVLTVVTSFGPWGAFSVAERSQVNRLEGILERNGLLEEGLYVQPTAEIPDEDEVQINEIVRYLSSNHSLDTIEHWFDGEDLDTLADSRWKTRNAVITEKFGLEVRHHTRVEFFPETKSFGLYIDPAETTPIDIEGYKYAISVDHSVWEDSFVFEGESYELKLAENNRDIVLEKSNDVLVTFDLVSLLELAESTQRGQISRDDAVIEAEQDGVRYMLAIEHFSGSFEDEGIDLHMLEGLLFLSQ